MGLWGGVEALEICGVGGDIGDLVGMLGGWRQWRFSGVLVWGEVLEI